MVRKTITIKNPTGLHLRPAGLMCKTAMEFKCQITLQIGNYSASAKSVLGVLGACVKCGDEVELLCDGVDEEVALDTLVALIDSGLGEGTN